MIVKKIKLICLKPVPGNPIEVRVKIKAPTVENPPTKKKNNKQKNKIRSRDLIQKESCRGSWCEKKFLQAEKVQPSSLF